MGKLSGNLYMITASTYCNNVAVAPKTVTEWHSLLGHPSVGVMAHLDVLKGQLKSDNSLTIQQCEVCARSKLTRKPFPILNRRSSVLFELVHADIWGPYHEENIDNVKYMLTLVEDHSRVTWIYLLSSKGQVCSVLKQFILLLETQFGKRIKYLRTDNGTEFVNHAVSLMLGDFGIIHQRSCVYTPQQNGIVERRHRSLLQIARALMFDSHLPKKFWPYSLLTATWLLNRLPSRVLEWKSPYSLLFGKEPCLADLHPFGCLVYATNLHPSKSKFDSRSLRSVFLGYATSHKGYLLFDLDHSQVFIARDVQFVHSTFPFSSIPEHTSTPDSFPDPYSIDDTPTSPIIPESDPSLSMESPSVSSDSPPTSDIESSPVIQVVEPLRRSSRATHPPLWMRDYVGSVSLDCSLVDVSSASTTPYTFPYHISPSFTPTYTAFLINVTHIQEPSSYKEASGYIEWVDAMEQELSALESNSTWEVVDLPPGKRPIGCKWVYKVKLNTDGTVERFKARLVAKGYTQEYGIDYTEVFSPVAKLVSVRLLIAVATANSWPIYQIDVNNAFLHGFLHDEIYMLPPQGYHKAKRGQVCKLIKSLYGLKQASREWNAEFCLHLYNYGFRQSSHDHCLFVKGTGDSFMCLLVYVDDILLTGPTETLLSDLKSYLHSAFTIKDLGLAHYFLGMEIVRGSSGTALNQRKYVLDLIDSVGLLGCRAAHTPFPPGLVLASDDGDVMSDPDSYRRLVGKLLYLNLTRPDLTYCVQQLSQFVGRPCSSHWNAAMHVLKYLKGCPSLGLFYPASCPISLTAYSDADWGTCVDTRRSLTGFCIFFGSCLISWRCKKQTTVSASSAEAEYRSLSATVRELSWLAFLCADFGLTLPLPVPLYCDNQAAIHITKNQVFHERTKHLDIDCHLVRDKYRDGFLVPLHVTTSLQLADLFTKSLPRPRFLFLLSKLGLVDIHRLQLAGG